MQASSASTRLSHSFIHSCHTHHCSADRFVHSRLRAREPRIGRSQLRACELVDRLAVLLGNCQHFSSSCFFFFYFKYWPSLEIALNEPLTNKPFLFAELIAAIRFDSNPIFNFFRICSAKIPIIVVSSYTKIVCRPLPLFRSGLLHSSASSVDPIIPSVDLFSGRTGPIGARWQLPASELVDHLVL